MIQIGKKFLVVTLAITFCLFSGCSGTNDTVRDQLEKDKASLERAAEAYDDNATIWGINLINDVSPTIDNVVYLDSIEDNLHVIVIGKTPEGFNGALKILLDYKEVEFAVGGMVYSSYPFHSEANDGFEITINLPGDIDFSYAHMITVVALPNFDKHRADGFLFHIMPLSMDFEIAPNHGTNELRRLSEADKAEAELTLPYSGLMLNQDFKAVDADAVNFPSVNVEAKAGESVKFAYRVGNYENSDEVLFYVFVGDKQYPINGRDFIHVSNYEGKIAYGLIELVAPIEPGKYEITAFATSTPYKHRTQETAQYSDVAKGFTLTVNDTKSK